MRAFALVEPWEFRRVGTYRQRERDEYLRLRRQRGHDAAEEWRTSWRCLNAEALDRLVLEEASWAAVRRGFGRYASRYEDLTDLERLVVVGVLEERKERERERRR